MKSITSKWKIWVIITLAIIAVGMIMLGFLGTNEAIDFSKSYELEVGSDQQIEGVDEQVLTLTEKYFEDKGIKSTCYSTQKTGDGLYIFKFYSDPEIDTADLRTTIKTAITDNTVVIQANVKQVVSDVKIDVLGISLALGISAVVIFLFVLIKDKLKACLSVLGASVASILLTLALIAITRVPSAPFMPIALVASLLLTSILSSGMVARFKEEKKNAKNQGLLDTEIADIVAKKNLLRYLCFIIALVVFSLVLGLVNMGYLSFIAIQVLIVGIVSAFSSYVFTPTIWSAVKNNKKN